jgi:DNA adenine methylase
VSKPLLRWAGSKRSTIDLLGNWVPKGMLNYIEPFCGSAALFFHLRGGTAILNDINFRLMNFYKYCKHQPEELIGIVGAMERSSESYYKYRKNYNEMDDGVVSAAYFYYLNRNCFNGLYRTDRQGKFNVPFSDSRTGRIHSPEEFLIACSLLKNASLSNIDFEELIDNNLGEKNFFFIDPPYAISRRVPFTEYFRGAFTVADLDRLLQCLERIDDAGGYFLMTFDGSSDYQFCVRETWSQSTISVRRNIAGFSSARKNASEIILSNYVCVE